MQIKIITDYKTNIKNGEIDDVFVLEKELFEPENLFNKISNDNKILKKAQKTMQAFLENFLFRSFFIIIPTSAKKSEIIKRVLKTLNAQNCYVLDSFLFPLGLKPIIIDLKEKLNASKTFSACILTAQNALKTAKVYFVENVKDSFFPDYLTRIKRLVSINKITENVNGKSKVICRTFSESIAKNKLEKLCNENNYKRHFFKKDNVYGYTLISI